MEKLTKLLNNVSDSYYDFVVGVLNYAKRKQSNVEAMISYIENNPSADTSDITEYMMGRADYFEHAERVGGIKPQVQAQV